MDPTSQRAPFPGRATLIGRDAELAVLEAAVAAAADGWPAAVLLSGEPGVGKSRLLAEACTLAASAHGTRVLHGFALEGGGLPPYFPLVCPRLRPARSPAGR
jgi:predicted ATPase